MRKAEIMKYKRAITKADFLVTLVCIILAFLNLGGLSSMGRERARRMLCAATMARLAQANHIYANNWDEQFCPPMMEDRTAPIGPPDERRHIWLTNHDFQKYMGFDERQMIGGLIPPKEYQCPSNILFKEGRASAYYVLVSYAYNVSDWAGNPNPGMDLNCFWQSVGECTSGLDPPTWQIGHKRTVVRNASKKINFTDSGDWWCACISYNGANYEMAWDIVGHGNWDDYSEVGVYGPVLYRHNEGANFAFYDGHVEWLPKEEAFIKDIGGSTPPERDATGMWYVLEW